MMDPGELHQLYTPGTQFYTSCSEAIFTAPNSVCSSVQLCNCKATAEYLHPEVLCLLKDLKDNRHIALNTITACVM